MLNYECDYPGEKAIARARALVGGDYNLVWSNCEHFVTEVRTGTPKSIQIENAAMVLGVGVVIAVAAAIVFGLFRKSKKGKNTQ